MENLRFALRRLLRNKIYSVIIILSLVTGFTCNNLLISFLASERSTDSFHTKKDRIFQVFSTDPMGSAGRISYVLQALLDFLKDNYSEVEGTTQLNLVSNAYLTSTGDPRKVILVPTDTAFLSLFDFPLYQGSASHALDPGKIILSRATAAILFDSPEVIGKVVTLQVEDSSRNVTVSAIMDDFPENSHLNFDVLINRASLKNVFGGASYVLLRDGVTVNELETKLNKNASRPDLLGEGKANYFFTPLLQSYFSQENRFSFMKNRNMILILAGYAVCSLVMLMAGFNFVNLFLLSLQERRLEAGIRKTLGISVGDVLKACTTEILLYVITAFVTSLALTYVLLPTFNNVLGATLSFSYVSHFNVWATLAGVIILLGVVVTGISVRSQWKVKPISLLKSHSKSRLTFSKTLFTVQFIVSTTLVVCSVTVIRQMEFLKNSPIGFNKSIIELPAASKDARKMLPVLKEKVLQIPGIEHVAVGSGNPISGNTLIRYDLDNGEVFSPFIFSGDADFIETLDLEVVQGSPLGESQNGKLVNETLVKKFGMKNPIGEKIPGTKDDVIVGVVKDFTCVSFKQNIPPVIISYKPDSWNLFIDYRAQEVASLLPVLAVQWKSLIPSQPFSYKIIQDELMSRYKDDIFFYRIITSFAAACMVISCFGLFAMSWAVTQSRTREIGIRKVLGATVMDICGLLTWTFARKILIGIAIAIPLGYYIMNEWLAGFVNKISIDAFVFALSVSAVVLVALLTLGFQTIRAALASPVDELRSE